MDRFPKLTVLLNIHDMKKIPSFICPLSFVPRLLLLNLIKRLCKQMYLLRDNNIWQGCGFENFTGRMSYLRLLILGVRYCVEWKQND